MTSSTPLDRGTASAPRFMEACTDKFPGILGHGRTFVYENEDGLVAGVSYNVTWTVDHPIEKVWHYLKDWNLWMNGANYYYSAVIGDLAPGERFTLGKEPGGRGEGAAVYEMVRVVPEQMMAIDQPVPTATPKVGLGGLPYGFHVMSVDEVDGQSTATYLGQHESLAATGNDAKSMSAEEAVAPWLTLLEGARSRWYEVFIPSFRELLEAGAVPREHDA